MGFATYPSLKDRVVFITGGGSGIGASMVEAAAAVNCPPSCARPRRRFGNFTGRNER